MFTRLYSKEPRQMHHAKEERVQVDSLNQQWHLSWKKGLSYRHQNVSHFEQHDSTKGSKKKKNVRVCYRSRSLTSKLSSHDASVRVYPELGSKAGDQEGELTMYRRHGCMNSPSMNMINLTKRSTHSLPARAGKVSIPGTISTRQHTRTATW